MGLSIRIMVPVKRVVDHRIRVQMHPDGRQADTARLKHVINPFDAVALETAVQWQSADVSLEICAVGIGEASEEVLRHALAVGAHRAIQIRGDHPTAPQPLDVARLLHHVAQQTAADLVLMGKQSIDHGNQQTGPMLAGIWGVPQITAATQIAWDPAQRTVTAWCDRGEGVDQYTTAWPCVITVDLPVATPRYASLPQLLQAKRHPLELWECPLSAANSCIRVGMREPVRHRQPVPLDTVDALCALVQPLLGKV